MTQDRIRQSLIRFAGPSLLALGLALAATTPVTAEPDKPKPKEDVTITAGQAGQAEFAPYNTPTSSNGRGANLAAQRDASAKAAQKQKAAQQAAARK